MTLVSVIVTTKNEEANIERCLWSIKRQTHRNIEIIVVDNHSTDRTKDIAQKFTPHVFNLGPERSAQRNFGIKQARGKIVLYVDADMALSPNVIAACVEAFAKDPETVGLYVPERVVGGGFWIKVRDHERSFYDGTAIDAVRAIRRETFDLIGGFDENLTGVEDWDFDIRVRRVGKTAIIASPILHNEHAFNIKNYLKKKSYYGQSFAAYRRKWSDSEPSVGKQFDFFYRYVQVFVEDGKVLRLLSHPVLSLGMFGLRAAVGISYIATLKEKAHVPLASYQERSDSEQNSEHEQSA